MRRQQPTRDGMAAVVAMLFAAVTSLVLLGIIRHGQYAAIDRQLAVTQTLLDANLQAACEHATARLLANPSLVIRTPQSLTGWPGTTYTITRSGSNRVIVATSAISSGALRSIQRSRTVVHSSSALAAAGSRL